MLRVELFVFMLTNDTRSSHALENVTGVYIYFVIDEI